MVAETEYHSLIHIVVVSLKIVRTALQWKCTVCTVNNPVQGLTLAKKKKWSRHQTRKPNIAYPIGIRLWHGTDKSATKKDVSVPTVMLSSTLKPSRTWIRIYAGRSGCSLLPETLMKHSWSVNATLTGGKNNTGIHIHAEDKILLPLSQFKSRRWQYDNRKKSRKDLGTDKDYNYIPGPFPSAYIKYLSYSCLMLALIGGITNAGATVTII